MGYRKVIFLNLGVFRTKQEIQPECRNAFRLFLSEIR